MISMSTVIITSVKQLKKATIKKVIFNKDLVWKKFSILDSVHLTGKQNNVWSWLMAIKITIENFVHFCVKIKVSKQTKISTI